MAELKALEKSKASEIESLRKESETVVLQLKQKQEGEIEALKTAHTSVISTKTAEITALESSYTEAQGVHAAELEAGKKQLELATADARQLRKDLEERADQLASVRSAMETTAASLSEVQSMLDSERTAHALTTSAKDNAEAAVFELKAEVETLDAKALAEEAVQKKLRNTIQELKGNIRVFCRVRPMLAADTTSDSEPVQVFDLGADKKAIQVQNPEGRSNAMGESKTEVKHFAFDHVFGESSTQDEVFGEVGQLVQSAVDGYKVCVFCYGQTGSGKTFTMQGPEDCELTPGCTSAGLIPRSVEQIFVEAEKLGKSGWSFEIYASFLEIYNDSLFDLLDGGRNGKASGNKLEIKLEKGRAGKTRPHVPELKQAKVSTPGEVYSLLTTAAEVRSTEATAMNERSSRSHSVFQLRVTGINSLTGENTSGVLNLIDLAGSERTSKSKVDGDRAKEANEINKSLSNLSNCIMALANKDKHVPFRNSKLTHYLEPFLGGDAKALMFVNVASEPQSFNESLCSLRFAQKVNACEIGTARRGVKIGGA